MQQVFDPYYHWLGIWPHEQPADLYRLLGLTLFESNPALINAAADQRMAHVHTFRLSPQAAWSQRLLNELAFARVTLLEPGRKAAYDAVLRSMLPAFVAEVPGPTAPQRAAAPPMAWPVVAVKPAEPPLSPILPAPVATPVRPVAAPVATVATPTQPVVKPVQPVAAPVVTPAAAAPAPTKPAAVTPGPTTSSAPAAPTGPRPVPIPSSTAAPVAAPTREGDWAVGSLVGRFQLLEKVSASALAPVFKAQDTQSGRLYFLKHLPAGADQNVEVQKRFQREIDIVTKLDHPNLIVGRETGTHQGRPYLLMDYVMGADLGTLVQQQGRLSVDDAVRYLAQAARGLGQLHLNGVFHRNVKPQVLLVDVQGVLRITNLLLAKLGESSTIEGGDEGLTVQGEQMGTFDYVAPEQAADARAVDARSDLYALGCTLCFLLLARPPYVAKKPVEKLLAHRRDPVPSLRNLREDVPEWLDLVFQKLLAKNPADRFQSADELLEQLERKMPESMRSSSSTAASSSQPWWRKLLALVGVRSR